MVLVVVFIFAVLVHLSLHIVHHGIKFLFLIVIQELAHLGVHRVMHAFHLGVLVRLRHGFIFHHGLHLLVMFLQQITPYVDTRDRRVAGLLRGLSGSINAVAGELMKRTDALLAREGRHELRAAELETAVAALQQQVAAIRDALNAAASSGAQDDGRGQAT